MNLAAAVRLARRLHRGEIDEGGEPYVDHLARVAAAVAAGDGDESQQMAAWLHGAGRTGLRPRDLAECGVPRAVIEIISALEPRTPWETPGEQARRIRACPAAALVLRADVADLARPQARAAYRPGTWRYRAGRYRDLLGQAGVPIPDGLSIPEPRSVPDLPGSAADAGPLAQAYLAAAAAGPGSAGTARQQAAELSRLAVQRRFQADPGWVATMAGLAGQRNAFLRATGIRGLAGLAAYQDLIVKALADDSPQVVDAALGSLTTTGGLAGTLAQIAGRPDPAWTWPRRRALRLLIEAGDPRARALLVAALAADGMSVGLDLIKLLEQDPDQQLISALVSQLRGAGRGRAAAAFLLGQLRARPAAGDLAAVLAEDPPDLGLSLACIQALGKLADPGSVPALAAAARHRLAWVRSEALLALSRIDHPAIAQIAFAACEDFDPGVRDRAVRVLAARGGPEATARLLTFCTGPLAPAALRGLARIGDERTVPALTSVFQDSGDRQVRHLAGRALARSARRAPALYTTAQMPPVQVRAVAWVLGEIADSASSMQLSDLLRHRDERVRARAAAALGKIADPRTAPALRAALTDISARVRAAAATALGHLRTPEAAEWLEPSRSDPHPAVRTAANAAIRKLRHARPAP
jgi:HEAT repeat protein